MPAGLLKLVCADLSDVDLQVQDGGGFGTRPGVVEAALSARGTTLAAQLAQLPLSAHMLAMRGTTRASGGLRAVIRAMRAVVLQVVVRFVDIPSSSHVQALCACGPCYVHSQSCR